MTRDQLLAEARSLRPPPPEVAAKFTCLREGLAAELNRRFLQRPDLDQLIGPDKLEMMRNNHLNQVRFLSTLFQNYQPEVFVDTVLWVFRAYRSHGFRVEYWPAQFETWFQVLKEFFTPDEQCHLEPFFQWLLEHQADFEPLSAELPGDGDISPHD